MSSIDRKITPVREALQLPDAPLVREALEVFESPACMAAQNCFVVDFTDAFSFVTPTPNHIVPTLWRDPLKLHHLGDALRWLLASHRFPAWCMAHNHQGEDLSSVAVAVLVENYLETVIESLKKSGAMNAIYADVAMLKNELANGLVKNQHKIEERIEAIILGYTIVLEKELGMRLDWKKIKEEMVEEREKIISKPEPDVKLDKPLKQKPTPSKKKTSPTVLPELPPVDEEGPPKDRAPAGNLEEKPVSAVEKRKKLESLARVTGGIVQQLLPGEDIFHAAIKPRLKLDKPKKHYQIFFLLDASGSMKNSVSALRRDVSQLMEHAQSQLVPGGMISIGVGYYVDETSVRNPHLDSIDTLKMRASLKMGPEGEIREAQAGLSRTIEHIQTIGGGSEYHWDEAMKVLKGEPWASSDEDIEKVIFLLTDEEGDIGDKKYVLDDVLFQARQKKVRFEVIEMVEDPSTVTFHGKALEKFPELRGKTFPVKMTIAKAIKVLSYGLGNTLLYGYEEKTDAIRRLVKTGSPRYLPYLANAMDPSKEKSEAVRNNAVIGMGQLKTPRAFPYLLQAITLSSEDDGWVWSNAMQGLAEIGDAEAIIPILKLKSRFYEKRDPKRHDSYQVDDAKESFYKVIRTFSKSNAIPVWMKIAQDKQFPKSDRQLAIETLKHFSEPDVRKVLVDLVTHDSERYVRGHAVITLGKIGTRNDILALLPYFPQETNAWVRERMADVFGEHRLAEATPLLLKELKKLDIPDKDRFNYTPSVAAAALGKIGGPGVADALFAAIADAKRIGVQKKDTYGREDPGMEQLEWASAEALVQLGDARGISYFMKEMQERPTYSQQAILILVRSGNAAVLPILSELMRRTLQGSDFYQTRFNLCQDLGKTGQPILLPLLDEIAKKDPARDIRTAAKAAAQQIRLGQK
ncbi:MAG: HEAT repeat domain-containing protein [Deltaproteobacteria bacterium]|nr:HEAT repeat domain-containing protein [Deltaproteobacteria bacterium]